MRVLNFPSAYQPGETPYQLFKDRMTAVSSIVGGIKDIITNRFINKQNSMIAENIQNKIDEQKATDLSNLILSDPPDEIYPANLEDTVGQFIDKFAMGPMRQKETMLGNLPSTGTPGAGIGPVAQKEIITGGLPAVGGATPTTPTTEAMIPKAALSQIYNVVKSLPTGDITWNNIYKKMTENKPYWMGTTESEQFVLNQMMGQISDPRAKIASDINLSKLVKEAFYPEAEEEKRPGKYPYSREEVLEYEALKAAGKPDIKSILENIPEGFEINSLNVSTTGTTSFSFKPIDKTTPWEFDTWDEAQEFLRTHPQEGFVGKIETHGKGFDLTWYKETGEGGLKPITGSDIKTFETMIYGDEESPGVITPEDYAKVKDYIARTEKNFPVPVKMSEY